MKRTHPPLAAFAAALTLVAPARATDYWLVKSETTSANYSSLSGYGSDVGGFSGWTTVAGGTEREPFGDGDFRFGAVDPDGVYHIDGTGLANGMCLRLMGETGQVSYAFRGGSLVFEGGKAYVNNKTKGTFTVTNLCVVAGTTAELRTGDGGATVTYEGSNWVVESGAALFFNSGQDSTRKAVVRVPITGSGTIGQSFGEDSQYANSTGNLRLECDLGGFTGTIVACAKGINTTAAANNVAAAYKKQTLVFADQRAVPQSTPDGALLRGAVVVTNGARVSFTCDAVSPALRGWDFGSGQVPTVEVAEGKTATIFGPVTGTAGLTKEGKGTLVLDVGGTGLYGTITLSGSQTLSAADLDAYAEACEAWASGVPFLGAPTLARRNDDTSATFDVPVASIGRGAASATLSALVLEADAGDPWDDARAVAAPAALSVSSAGTVSFTATGLDPTTAYQIRFVLASSHDGQPNTVTSAPVAFTTRGALHVDAASTAADPDGSAAAPFPTIKAAVDAANAIAGAGTVVYVAPGVYPVSSAGDLATVSVPDLLVCAANPADKPVVALDANLSVAVNNPVVFAVPQGSDRLTVANLKFTYSYAANKNAAGNSLGESGKIFSFAANDCVFDGCEFVQTGTTGKSWQEGGLIFANTRNKGDRLVVRNCRFDHFGAAELRPIKIGNDAQIVGNVFDSCSGCFTVHQYASGGYFVSNRVVNCTNPIFANGDNFAELKNGEIAYNVFVSSGVPVFRKRNDRGYSDQPRFHHNTIVGCDSFIRVDEVNNTPWTPWIFDNLVIAAPSGCVIRENATSLANRTSSFLDGSFFTGNAWLAPSLVAGTAPENFPDSYSLGLAVSDNLALSAAPEFLDTTDATSTNFYRLNAVRYPWVRTTARGASGMIDGAPVSHPATYVGAVEPLDAGPENPGDYFELLNFTADLSANIAPAEASFAVEYGGNAGTVTVEWDFDGDGVFERSGAAATAAWTYAAGGDFLPRVRLTDAATGKTVSGGAAFPLKIRLVDVYVDALAAAGGDGTAAAPLRSLARGVAICAAHGTVHVRGGVDRVYDIATADDLVVVNEPCVTISGGDGEERARIVVARTLHSQVPNPSVIHIPPDMSHATIRGLDFTYYGSGSSAADASLGQRGRCIDVQGYYATVDDCVFHQSGNYAKANGSLIYTAEQNGIGHAAVATRAQQSDKSSGQHLTVSRCLFLGESDDRSMAATRLGEYSTLSGNVFSNCCQVLWAVKESPAPFLIESNVLYRCNTVNTGIYGSYGEFQNAEIRYNVFWCDPGSAVPFLTKNYHGLSATVLIHHNTIVNASHLAEMVAGGYSWHPRIFDNLVVLDPASEDGLTVFKNNQTAFASGNFSSFKTGSDGCLKNNAWYAPDGISGGAATQVAGYDLSAGCEIADNVVLAAPPAFVSTKLDSPDFCRPASRNGDWVGKGYAWTGENGEYDDWIGAKPGMVARLTRTMILVR